MLKEQLRFAAIAALLVWASGFGGNTAQAAGPKKATLAVATPVPDKKACQVTVYQAVGAGQEPRKMCFDTKDQAESMRVTASSFLSGILYQDANWNRFNPDAREVQFWDFDCSSQVQGIGWTNITGVNDPYAFNDQASSLRIGEGIYCAGIILYTEENKQGWPPYQFGASTEYVGNGINDRASSIQFLCGC